MKRGFLIADVRKIIAAVHSSLGSWVESRAPLESPNN
jgi:hypothetical protein